MPLSQLFADSNKPNILLLITDQERSVAEWPESYRATLAAKLPAMQRLMASGLSFDHAYTASCMCSPSRATFLTSQYPIVTGCTSTGGSVLPKPARFPNIASVLTAAGYGCYWMGKWHLLGGQEPGDKADELVPWGFQTFTDPAGTKRAWDHPDAGTTLSTNYLGGGTQGPTATNRNDQRYVADAQAFLANPPASPWCLVVSLVNPHDIHLGWQAQDGNYYEQSLYQGFAVPLPKDRDESPSVMPRGQNYYTWANRAAALASQQDFANFYVYLMQYVDGQIGTILSGMSESLTQETLIIRFADHGEMGLAHGMIEKFVNAYGQCVHVPLVFSNPVAYPAAQRTAALASTADLAPTLAALLQQGQFADSFAGTDLSPVLENPRSSVQDYVHFTYDDMAGGSGPSVIRGVRSQRWAYSVYLQSVTSSTAGFGDADWEMYDLAADPTETHNLAGTGLQEQETLDQALQAQMQAKRTAPAWYPAHWPPAKTSASRGGPPASEMAASRPVATVPGIEAQQALDLTYVGVPDTAALLDRTATPAGRAALASLVQVDPAVLESWIAAARA